MLFKSFRNLHKIGKSHSHFLKFQQRMNFSLVEKYTDKKKDGMYKKEIDSLMSKPTYTLRDYNQKVLFV